MSSSDRFHLLQNLKYFVKYFNYFVKYIFQLFCQIIQLFSQIFQSQNSVGVEAAPTARRNILVGDHQIHATTATDTLENTSMKKYCSGL